MKTITRAWIKKAEGDHTVALREIKQDQAVYDVICYHSHQCVEKYIKALLSEKGVDFGKNHDLENLSQSITEWLTFNKSENEGFIWLTQYAVRVRYPGFDASKKDADKAVKLMSKYRARFRYFFGIEEKELF